MSWEIDRRETQLDRAFVAAIAEKGSPAPW
jgi:hypothetical protein